jgi:hypothetical protein
MATTYAVATYENGDRETAEPEHLRTRFAQRQPSVIRAESAVWSISRIASRILSLARWWHGVTRLNGLRWVSV